MRFYESGVGKSYRFIKLETRYIIIITHFQVVEQSNAMQLAFATTLNAPII